MLILHRYLRHYWKLVATALVLAAVNQIFSLLDPLIFRHIIDSYATRYREYSSAQFLSGVSVLLGAAVGVAFVSRVAKNFQDYFVNLITQQVGARIYADGVRHSLELSYALFEDQRSGETLGKLQKVRTDVEKFISVAVNMVFTTLIGLVFVMIYALACALVRGARVSAHGAAAGRIEFRAEPQDQGSAEADRPRDDGAGGSDHGVAAQHRTGEEPGAGAAGDCAPQRDHGQDPQAGAEESALPAQPELRAGHLREPAADVDPVPDAVPDLHAAHHRRTVLFAVHLLVLHLWPAAGTRQRDQRVSRDGSLAPELRGDSGPAAGTAAASGR